MCDASVGMNRILEILRTSCHSQHEALHVHPFFAPLNRGEIAHKHYHAIIAMFHAAYFATEQIKPSSSLVDAPVMEWLEADMNSHHIPKLKWAAPALRIDNPARFLGYLYVKQGSTLGGQVISKHLHDALGLVQGIDNHFFHGYGKETGPEWKRFQAQLVEQADALSEQEVVDSAVAAFESIRISADRMVAAS